MVGPFLLEGLDPVDHVRSGGYPAIYRHLPLELQGRPTKVAGVKVVPHGTGRQGDGLRFDKPSIQAPIGVAPKAMDPAVWRYPDSIDHGAIGVDDMGRVAHHPEGNGGRNLIEHVPVEVPPLHPRVVAPGNDRFGGLPIGGLVCPGHQGPEPIEHGVPVGQRWHGPPLGIGGGDRAHVIQSHVGAREAKVGMGVNKPWEKYLLCEAMVDFVGDAAKPGLKGLKGADGDDAPFGNGDGRRLRSPRIHGDDFFCRKDGELFHGAGPLQAKRNFRSLLLGKIIFILLNCLIVT